MKNSKKIVAFLLVVTLMLVSSISVSAFTTANATKYTLKIEAPETAKVGETFTVRMYVDSIDSATMSVSKDSSNLLTFSYDHTKLTLGNTTPANNSATFGAGVLEGWLDYSLESTAATFTPGETIATAEFTANEAGTYTFGLDPEGFCSMGTVTFLPASMGGGSSAGLICDPITVTVTAGGGEEEVFETGLEGTASTSTVAFFGKNPTNAPLAAGTYGVWFGGVKYPAGINPDTNCGIGEKFVVRFTVDPSKPYSAIPKGTYTYKVYYNDGANMTESTVTIE